jgi:hypothetical protein
MRNLENQKNRLFVSQLYIWSLVKKDRIYLSVSPLKVPVSKKVFTEKKFIALATMFWRNGSSWKGLIGEKTRSYMLAKTVPRNIFSD